jgi:excisionase family DNA binding protein
VSAPEVSSGRTSISIPELARRNSVSKAHLYRLAARGQLPGAYRMGRRVLVHLETFERETEAMATNVLEAS